MTGIALLPCWTIQQFVLTNRCFSGQAPSVVCHSLGKSSNCESHSHCTCSFSRNGHGVSPPPPSHLLPQWISNGNFQFECELCGHQISKLQQFLVNTNLTWSCIGCTNQSFHWLSQLWKKHWSGFEFDLPCCISFFISARTILLCWHHDDVECLCALQKLKPPKFINERKVVMSHLCTLSKWISDWLVPWTQHRNQCQQFQSFSNAQRAETGCWTPPKFTTTGHQNRTF